MINRMLRAIMLDVSLYEEVEADRTATTQAMLVVVIVAVVTGLGTSDAGLGTFFFGVIFAIAGWAVWAWVTYFVGTRILPTPETHADWGEMARGLGFAQSVGILQILGLVPGVGPLLAFAILIWQIAAMVIAVRQVLDYTSTLRAIGVVIIGAIPYVIVYGFLLSAGGSNA